MEPSRDIIRQNKTDLQHILMPHIHFVLQCVREEKLLAKSEYASLKSVSPPSKAAADLADKMVSKGEKTCGTFLRLLRDARLTDVCPGLKAAPWRGEAPSSSAPSSTRPGTTPPLSEEGVDDAASCGHAEEERCLFCEDEQRVVCRVCDSSHHPGHKLLPLERAVDDLKDQLESDLRTLKDKMGKYERFKDRYTQDVVEHNEKQASAAEKRIRAEFEKLRQFLAEEEGARLEALREEEKRKAEIVRVVEEQISSLSSSIAAIEQELQEQHGVSFLSHYKNTRARTRVLCTLSDPQDHLGTEGALIDAAKHLGNLTFSVWEKMRERVTFTPVVLDPNTAYAYLRLSEDLTGVRNTDGVQRCPDNPERFTNGADVLGSEGYGPGTRRGWDVEVGDHPCWNLGLAKESVERKRESYSSPENGIWCLCRKGGRYSNGCSDAVLLRRNPERIRVRLDYDGGEVSFYDAKDMTHIYTHRDTFGEKLYPYFSVGEAGDAQTTDIKVCPVSVTEQMLRSFN